MRIACTPRIVFSLALAWMLPLCSAPALALDPTLDLSQYAHTAWKIRDGFTASTIGTLAQTTDGYLWLGTGSGLLRFDGVRATPWQPSQGQSLPDGAVRVLLGSRDGSLWIGTFQGLAHWDGRVLRNIREFEGVTVDALFQDREGAVWAGGRSSTTGKLCSIRTTGTECYGDDGRFGPNVTTVYEDQKGTLWLAAANGLWRWKPGPPQLYTPPEPMSGGLQRLTETPSGAILVVTTAGIRQFAGGRFEPLPLPTNSAVGNILRDRDGSIWMGTLDGGVLHLHGDRVDNFDNSDGLSGPGVGRLFEDREGSMWLTGEAGLDRFRALPATTYSAGQGLSGFASSLLPDGKGGIWITSTTGLYRWRDGRFSVYRAKRDPSSTPRTPAQQGASEVVVENLPGGTNGTSLFEDKSGRLWLGSRSGFGYLENTHFVSVGNLPSAYIDSIVQDKQGNVWLLHRDLGLLRISPDLKIEQLKWPNPHKAQDWWRLAVDPVEGLWLASFAGGVVHLVNGAIRASYSAAEGLGKGIVYGIRVTPDGTVWVATNGGLSRIRNGRVATLSSKDGLPCDAVDASIEDDDGAIWIYTTCGLVRIAPADLAAWGAAVDQGKPAPTIRTAVLSNSDGVYSRNPPGGSATPHLAKAQDGTLWFASVDGVTRVDPHHLPINTLPPPVHVEQLVADRKAYSPSGPLALPPLVRDLAIDYTALSLVAPEKIQFRYKLEGRDRDWEDAGNRRQAFYTDLAPGNYRFRVIASNNSGVWNEEGTSLAFTIAPALWQSYWFLALCAIALVAFLWDMYRLRMRQLARAQAIENRQHEMELELAHASRLATLGQLTASIAHEVNQPLGAAITNAQAGLRWLKANPPDIGEAADAFDQVVRAGNRAAEVVARVRSMGKKSSAPADDLVVNDKITAMLAVANSEIVKHGIEVRTELAPDLPLVKGDRVQLQQVVLNLIVNAVEAMSTLTDGPRELTIRSEADGDGGVIVSVSDTGPGLTPEASARLFQPFYTSKKEGLGLGLSICQSIIEAHHGKLWASANTPRGAIFQFTLPPTRPY